MALKDYFDGVERLLKTTAPSEVHNNSNYNKSALKRVLKEYTSKDMRRNIEALYKRVDKHFSMASDTTGGDDGSNSVASGLVLAGVWKACEEGMVRDTEKFNRFIGQCYEGVGLEYTIGEVESYFVQRGKGK